MVATIARLGTSNDFNLTIGDGVDCKLNHAFGVRPAQAEYLHDS